jgi:copper homeostasis protein
MPPPARPVLLEACVDTLASARAAMRAGADRLELCGPGDGGTTPSHGLIACVRAACRVPLFVMIRPRPGPFTCTDDEFAVTRADVAAAKALGADGVVAGILREDGRVDAARMATLVADAAPLPVTMHRAFDRAADLPSALDALVDAGVARVLTSGGAPTALAGADALARLVAHAGGRVAILAGGGVRAHTVQALLARSGVREVHARATDPVPFAELAAVLP